ncbi:MAG: redox-regulated ATPase YchF, partial [Thermoplasmata archaeon]|nr:redox-regulated ATPase YchF [Thermoplasmata archaeon]
MEIGLVGKPNVGKSTFFSAATLASAEIASYPFTTIEANRGVGYLRAPCPHVDFGVECNPRNSLCVDGTRLIPIELIDVAGLVPEAHTGKGLGNRFLDDLRQAHVLIHVVDASGSTDAEGNPCKPGERDPVEDIRFLDDEISYWIAGILQRGWEKTARMLESTRGKIEEAIHDRLTGLGVTEAHVYSALRRVDLPDKPRSWTEEHMLSLAREIRREAKPIVIAANKMDMAEGDVVERMRKEGDIVVPTAAEYELALRRAAKAGLVDYTPGAGSFSVKEGASLSQPQRKALDRIAEYLEKHGSTGVQECMEKAAYEVLGLIPVYPVEDETHYTDKEGRVLPDAYLMPPGSTALDLAARVHTDLAEGFIRAIDVRTKRVVGHDHPLKAGDVIRIVAR